MATTISIALPQNYSPPPPPYASVLSARRPRSLSLSAFRTNPAFMTVSVCNLISPLCPHPFTGSRPHRLLSGTYSPKPVFSRFLLGNSFLPSPTSQWLSILLLRVHQNALVARWLNSWQWLASPSTSSASGGAYETAWLRGWVAARQDYVMTCWDAVRYHISHPSASFKVGSPSFPS